MFKAISEKINDQIKDLKGSIEDLTKKDFTDSLFSVTTALEIAKEIGKEELMKVIDQAVADIKTNLGDDTYKTISAIETVLDIKTYKNLDAELNNLISLVKSLMTHQLDVVCFLFYMSISKVDFDNISNSVGMKTEGDYLWNATDAQYKNLIEKLEFSEKTTKKELQKYYGKYQTEYRLFMEVLAYNLSKSKNKISIPDSKAFYTNQTGNNTASFNLKEDDLKIDLEVVKIKKAMTSDAENFINTLRNLTANGSMTQNLDQFISQKIFNFINYAQEISAKKEELDLKINVNKTVLFSNVFAAALILEEMKKFMGESLLDVNVPSLINIDAVGYEAIINQFNVDGDATQINLTVDKIQGYIDDLKFDFSNFNSPYDALLKQAISYPFKLVLEKIGKLYSTDWCNARIKEFRGSYEQYSKDINEVLANMFSFGVDEDVLKLYFTTAVTPIATKCMADLYILKGVLLSLEGSKAVVKAIGDAVAGIMPDLTLNVENFLYGNSMSQWLYSIAPYGPNKDPEDQKSANSQKKIQAILKKINQLRAFSKTVTNLVKVGEKVMGVKGG